MSRSNAEMQQTRRKAGNKPVIVREITSREDRPATYDPNFKVTRKMRYVVGSAQATLQPVTFATLIESFGMVATATNSAAVPVFGFIRIKSIEVWGLAPNGSSGPSRTECALVWGYQGSANTPVFSTNKEVNSTSTNISHPPYFLTRPPKGSAASLWQPRLDPTGVRRTGATNVAFDIQCNVGTIIDIVAELVAYDLGPSTAINSVTISVGTAGAFGYAALDGVGFGMTPVGCGYFT